MPYTLEPTTEDYRVSIEHRIAHIPWKVYKGSLELVIEYVDELIKAKKLLLDADASIEQLAEVLETLEGYRE